MKKYYLQLFFLLITLVNLNAQDRAASIGITHAYNFFENPAEYYASEDQTIKAHTLGIEYSERHHILGFRVGISYTKLENQYYDPYGELIFIDVLILPSETPLEIIDFPISGQLYLGKKKLKLHASLGLINSLSFLEVTDENYYYFYSREEPEEKSFSISSLYGFGLSYQFIKHFGIEVGINKRNRLYTFDNSYLKPYNGFNLQTKVSYTF